VSVAIHRGLGGDENCCFGSLTIATESRTSSRARRPSNSAPNCVSDPGITVATRRVRRRLVQRCASSTGTVKTEPSSPNGKERSRSRPPNSDTTSPLSNTSVGPPKGRAASFTRDFKGERRRTLRNGEYHRANAAAAKKANRVPMLSVLLNHWFIAGGCSKVSAMTTARKATMGSAAGIQPRRKASRFSLSKGSKAGCEVVVPAGGHCLAAIRCLWAPESVRANRRCELQRATCQATAFTFDGELELRRRNPNRKGVWRFSQWERAGPSWARHAGQEPRPSLGNVYSVPP